MSTQTYLLSFAVGLAVASLCNVFWPRGGIVATRTVTELPCCEVFDTRPCRPLAILGIFSTANDSWKREVIRETMFTDPFVCDPTDDCCHYLLPRFVISGGDAVRTELGREMNTTNDIIVLNQTTTAGMRYWWYHYAARNFPNASFIGKIDTDTLFEPSILANELVELRGFPLVAYGQFLDVISCGTGPPCDQVRGLYLSGALSMLSSKLVAWIGHEGNQIVRPRIEGYEDYLVGLWIREGMKAGLPPVFWAAYDAKQTQAPYLLLHGQPRQAEELRRAWLQTRNNTLRPAKPKTP